jgi:hypothetical protein
MALHVGYEPAGKCSKGPTSGARAMMSWYLGAYAKLGGTNLGIYNCRKIGGTDIPSLHGEGRAFDWGTPLGISWGQKLADRIVASSKELGLQCVIYAEQIWSGSYPYAGWRPYSGQNKHHDHIHGELTRSAARSLTVDRIIEVFGGQVVTPPRPPSKPSPRTAPVYPLPPGFYFGPLAGPKHSISGQHRTDRPEWRTGLRTWQTRMRDRGWRINPDGLYGLQTAGVTRAFQREKGLVVDGLIGPRTWRAAWEAPVT